MFIFKIINKRLDLKGLYNSEGLISWYKEYYEKEGEEIEEIVKDIKNDSDIEISILGYFDCVEVI